jgi:sulfur-oxidizing protein SoxB
MKRIALLISLAFCAVTNASATTITFMQFDDLHAHLTPHKDLVAQNGQTAVVERGGLARLATLVKRIRSQNPNSVLMNIGDTFHGGVEALYTNGNAIADPLNALGIDVGVAGNWDYAYGPSAFRLRYATGLTASQIRLLQATAGTIKKPAFTNLAANLTYAPPSTNSGYVMPPTIIKTIGGVKVGFIGLTSDIVAQMDATLATGFAFTQGETDYKNLINSQASTLRSQGAQLVVVMSELGLHKNYRLADVVNPGSVDVFFSAHTHEPTFTKLKGRSGALVLETGNDGNLGRLDVNVVTGQAPVYTWSLIPVDNTLAEDVAMKTLVDAARAPFLVANPNMTVPMQFITLKLTKSIDTVVGYVDGALNRREALESSFNDSWANALRDYAHTDLAITPGFRFDAVIANPGSAYEDGATANGAITVEEVYRFFPVPYTLAAGQIVGANLQAIMEGNLTSVFSMDSFKQQGGWVDGYVGLSGQVDLSAADGNRVKSLALKPSGITIAPDTVVSVSGCQRPNDDTTTLCGNRGYTNVTGLLNPNTGATYYVQDLFAQLLGSGVVHTASGSGITDIAATPLWPAQPFVQPMMVDVTGQTSIAKSAVSSQGVASVIVKNMGTSTITLPLKIVLENLTAGVTVSNATGTVYGLPYLKLPNSIAPGSSAIVTVQFNNPAGLPVSYTVRVKSGGV